MTGKIGSPAEGESLHRRAIEILRKALSETDEPFLRERLRQLEGSGERNPFGGGR